MSPRRVGWVSGAVTVVVVAVVVVAVASVAGLVVASPTASPLRARAIVSMVALSGLVGLAAGVAASLLACPAHGGDAAERLLALTTAGLPARRAEWGAAMRAELAAIEDRDARWRFARSASAAAFGHGLGIPIACTVGAAGIVGAVALTASRVQLQHGGPGVMLVTVPIPAILLLAVALVAAATARSFRTGLATGAVALVTCFAVVSAVVALEGMAWIEQRGVFVLDADPPRYAVGTLDIALDFFTTGLWVGHLVFWLPWPVVGAWVGAWIGSLRAAAHADSDTSLVPETRGRTGERASP